jgi:glycerol kinase
LDRRCKKAELVKAAEESIAYQIADIVFLMHKHAKQDITSLRVDGGPTNDAFLMQAQSDIIGCEVRVAALEELSGQGPALIAAKAVGILEEEQLPAKALYQPMMSDAERERNGIKDGRRQSVKPCHPKAPTEFSPRKQLSNPWKSHQLPG